MAQFSSINPENNNPSPNLTKNPITPDFAHERRSSIFTSQVPVEKWYEIIGDKTVADTILDRLVYSSHRIELKGESYRKRKSSKSEI